MAEQDVANFVRGMFDRIAPRYDLTNHVLSLGLDFYWRRRAVHRLRRLFNEVSPVIVDVCCGTGDLALAIARRARHTKRASVVAADFSRAMVMLGRSKAQLRRARVEFVEADALQLPLPEASANGIASAFGFRNLADYRAGLNEFYRALKPGGMLVILEFSRPTLPVFRHVFAFYFKFVLPYVGGWLAGDRDAYSYLPTSVGRFPSPAALAEWLRIAGFEQITVEPLTGGVAVLHCATKP